MWSEEGTLGEIGIQYAENCLVGQTIHSCNYSLITGKNRIKKALPPGIYSLKLPIWCS